MFEWLRRLCGSPKSPAVSTKPQPLSFSYRAKDGNESRVNLRDWTDDGEFLVGYPLSTGTKVTYRRDRIIKFHDLSYGALKHYRPPPGSPLDPNRLP